MIKAEIVADSYNKEHDSRITTFLLEYPRMIHSELMTHRDFSRNSSSSRAIPINKVIEAVRNNPAKPVHWGKNKAGMQAEAELDEISKNGVIRDWELASQFAAYMSEQMSQRGVHKQVANRITEPFQHMKVVLTSTKFNNWFSLRNHSDADPTIAMLASKMLDAFNNSKVTDLKIGQWHLPFVQSYINNLGFQIFFDDKNQEISLEQAQRLSCSSCAQVSYRKLDTSLEKADDIYKKLVESKPVHASAFEHCATPLPKMGDPLDYFRITGVTAIDKQQIPCSGNLHGWLQYRQLIPNNVVNY